MNSMGGKWCVQKLRCCCLILPSKGSHGFEKSEKIFFLPSLFVKMDGNFHNIKDGTR